MEETQTTICGHNCIEIYLRALKESGVKTTTELLRYGQSSKVTSPDDTSVSYCALRTVLSEFRVCVYLSLGDGVMVIECWVVTVIECRMVLVIEYWLMLVIECCLASVIEYWLTSVTEYWLISVIELVQSRSTTTIHPLDHRRLPCIPCRRTTQPPTHTSNHQPPSHLTTTIQQHQRLLATPNNPLL